MNVTNHKRLLFVFAALIGVILIGAITITVSAQETGTPITVGENQPGNITDPNSAVLYTLIVGAPMSINVQVLAITPGLAPTFRILDPSGVVILDTANPGTVTIVQGAPNLAGGVPYQIEVSSANGTAGQFLISVQPGAPLAPPQSLTPGQPLSGSLDTQTTRQAYAFSGSSTDVLLLNVRNDSTSAGSVVTLRNADTGGTLALTSAELAGVRYRIPVAQVPRNYLLEVTHGSTAVETFTVCLETESGSILCPGSTPLSEIVPVTTPEVGATPLPTFAIATIDPNGICMVVSLQGATINVRSGPGTNFSIVGRLSPTNSGSVIGRLPDNSWYQVNVGGVLGWVSASVVRSGGNCAGVPITQPPTVPPPIATTEVSPGTGTVTPTATATSTSPAPPPPVATLNFSLPPIYGSTALTSGFVPDPFTVGVTSGGPANVAYLGGGCSGYTSSAPSFSVNYTSGAFPTLRFYFITSAGDTTMIVNTPGGSYMCIDDSFGTTNPTLDFNSPATGRYDIWIGTYSDSTTFLGGTLYVTENTGNHP